MFTYFRGSVFYVVLTILIGSASSAFGHEYKVRVIPQDSISHVIYTNTHSVPVKVHICISAPENINGHIRLEFHGTSNKTIYVNDTNSPDKECELISLDGNQDLAVFVLHGTPNTPDGVATLRYNVILN